MIKLYFQKDQPESQKIKDRLDKMSLRYTPIEIEVDEDQPVPFIEDDTALIQGREALENWLIELEQELQEQRSISGDGCYIDPRNGKVC